MTIHLNCDSCGKAYSLKNEVSGQTFICQVCQNEILVPGEKRTTTSQILGEDNILDTGDDQVQIRGPRTNHVSVIFSFFYSVLLTILIYAAFTLFHESRIVEMFMERGPTPPVTVLFFTWALVILWMKKRLLRRQRKALALEIIPPNREFRITASNVSGILKRVERIVDNPANLILVNRVQHALFNLQNLKQVSDVSTILESQAESDEARLETSYALLRGFVWVMPVLGFIGTVLGLSAAVGGFGDVLSSAKDVTEITSSLTAVTSGLGTAFETTLVALVAAVVIQLQMTFLKKSEEDFLDTCREYCMVNVVRRLRLDTSDPNEWGGAADG